LKLGVKASKKNSLKAKKMDPTVIVGIISRESRAENVLKNEWDSAGNGFGLMQV